MSLPTIKTWAEGPVQLFLFDEPVGVLAWEEFLPTGEISRAAAMKSKTRAHSFLAARVALRQCLGAMLNTSSHDVPIIVSDDGKPMLVDGCLAFSLSHAHGRILIAASADATTVGVDIERINDETDIDRIARRLFSDAENAAIAATPADQRRAKAFEMWCLFEARYKTGSDDVAGVSGLLDGGFAYAACWR